GGADEDRGDPARPAAGAAGGAQDQGGADGCGEEADRVVGLRPGLRSAALEADAPEGGRDAAGADAPDRRGTRREDGEGGLRPVPRPVRLQAGGGSRSGRLTPVEEKAPEGFRGLLIPLLPLASLVPGIVLWFAHHEDDLRVLPLRTRALSQN